MLLAAVIYCYFDDFFLMEWTLGHFKNWKENFPPKFLISKTHTKPMIFASTMAAAAAIRWPPSNEVMSMILHPAS